MVTGISLEEAIVIIQSKGTPHPTEHVTLMDALGRTLAEDIYAKVDNPPFHRSPLDGYALRGEDSVGATKDSPVTLKVIDTVYAGDDAIIPVTEGTCVRIMTGAMLPKGCNCVIRQEDTDMGDGVVALYKSHKPFDNYCYQGEDFQSGALLVKKGQSIDSATLGVLASGGMAYDIPVYAGLKIALVTTGDEVVAPEISPLPQGKIYGSNGHLLWARLRELGVQDITFLHVADCPQAVADTLKELAQTHHAIFTTGGVSVGAKDIFHEAIPRLGGVSHFWRVQLKPGTPALFSTYEGTPILSLSGNPFAAAATFELMGRPLLATLSGNPSTTMVKKIATLATPFPKSSGGRRFIRGTYEEGKVTLPQGHSSGQLASLVGCNCLVDIAGGSHALGVGDKVTVHLM